MRPDDIEIVMDAAMADDPIFTVEIITPTGSLQLMGEFEIGSSSIAVRGLHIGGDPAVEWGWSKLRVLGRMIAAGCRRDQHSWSGSDNGCEPGT